MIFSTVGVIVEVLYLFGQPCAGLMKSIYVGLTDTSRGWRYFFKINKKYSVSIPALFLQRFLAALLAISERFRAERRPARAFP
jgi:hypothetical protein